jgi:outer membrane protein assembly factor BamB
MEPHIDARQVVFGDTGGHVWSYAHDGTLRWTKDVGAPILSKPWVDDEVVAVSTVGDVLAAYDAQTGALLWRHTHKAGLYRKATLALYVSSPVVRMGDLLLGGFSDGRLVALDRKTGEVRWQLAIGEGDYPDVVAPPDVGAAPVLITSGYFEPTVAYDTASRKLLWTADHGSAAAVARITDAQGRGRVIQPGTDGVLRALDALSGELVWSWTSGTEGALTEPVPTPAGLLVGSQAGTLWLIDPDVGVPTWTFDPGYVVEGLAAAPAVDGRQIVFATNGGNLYSLVTPAATPDARRAGWPTGAAMTHASPPRTTRAPKALEARAAKERTAPISNVPLDKPGDDAPLAPEDIETPR